MSGHLVNGKIGAQLDRAANDPLLILLSRVSALGLLVFLALDVRTEVKQASADIQAVKSSVLVLGERFDQRIQFSAIRESEQNRRIDTLEAWRNARPGSP